MYNSRIPSKIIEQKPGKLATQFKEATFLIKLECGHQLEILESHISKWPVGNMIGCLPCTAAEREK